MDTLFALIILASLVFLIIGIFNPNATLFWYKKEKTRTKSSIIYGIAFIASFVLFGVSTDTNKTAIKSNNAISTENENDTAEEQTSQKSWQTVYTFKGNGMKKSPTFELTGGEARLKYKYNSDNGMGMFAAYVVEQGKDIMKQGGIPEVMTSAENEESESSIQKSAGRFYLTINSIGNWTVRVEEYK